MILYNSPISGNCYKVRLLLAHLGIPYERHEVDVVDRSNREQLLGGRNPALRVPTLVLDDGRAFLVGETMTLADVALYAYTHVAPEGGFSLEPYPAVRAWLDRVAAEPGHVPIDA